MPRSRVPAPVTPGPGFDKRSTDLLVEGRWIDGDKVRSVGGVVETTGGWTKLDGEPRVNGICRGLHVWRSLDNKKNIAIGTSTRLYTLIDGTLTNITPTRDTGTLGTDPFTTVSGSKTVTVADTSHSTGVGDFVNYSGATAVGGPSIYD